MKSRGNMNIFSVHPSVVRR